MENQPEYIKFDSKEVQKEEKNYTEKKKIY